MIDASFMLAAILPDERHQYAEEVIQKYIDGTCVLLVPSVFPFEVANGIKMAIVRKRLTSPAAKEILKKCRELNIPIEDTDIIKVFSLAIKSDLSIYDASYVALAQTKNIPLLTLDSKMKKLTEK